MFDRYEDDGGEPRRKPAPARRHPEVDPAQLEDLLPIEVQTVKAAGASLRSYLVAKENILGHYKKHGPLRKREARTVARVRACLPQRTGADRPRGGGARRC